MEVMAADLVAGVPLAEVSPWALVALFVVLVATGRLVPRKTLQDVEHDRDEWRAESRIRDQQMAVKDEQIAEKDKQLTHMSEVGRMVQSIMGAIQTRASDDKAAP